jgi:hypothetical protein
LRLLVQGTDKGDKNEILWRTSGTNYNNLPEIFRKGSVLIWDQTPPITDSPDTLQRESAVNPSQTHSTVLSVAPPALSHLTAQSRAAGESSAIPLTQCKDVTNSTHLTPAREAGAQCCETVARNEGCVQGVQKSTGRKINVLHEDIIKEEFWTKYPNILI